MVRSLKAKWRRLKESRPGHRFQDRYARRKTAGEGSTLGRILNIALAAIFLALGLILVLIPGPAIPFLVISGGLLATESRLLAAGLDRLELSVRRWWQWGHRRWRALPGSGKVVLTGIALCAIGSFAYLSYLFVLVD